MADESLIETLTKARSLIDEARIHAAKDDKAMMAVLGALTRLERVTRALLRRADAQEKNGRKGSVE